MCEILNYNDSSTQTAWTLQDCEKKKTWSYFLAQILSTDQEMDIIIINFYVIKLICFSVFIVLKYCLFPGLN